MILTAFHGFCMALADSVPGVSGGTIAFIPFIAAAERTALKRLRGALFALLDMAVVVLTLLRGSSALGSVSFASLSLLLYLPLQRGRHHGDGAAGHPGSSILLIAGVYLPPFRLSAASCTWSFPCCRGSSRWASSARRSGGRRVGGQRMPEEPHRPPAPLLAGQQRAAAHR